jgi:hypothetical protein
METWANFANIRYTQNTISDVLQDGTPLQDLIVKLERGTTNAADLAVNVFKDKAGVFWALDNRRAYSIKEAFPGGILDNSADLRFVEQGQAGRVPEEEEHNDDGAQRSCQKRLGGPGMVTALAAARTRRVSGATTGNAAARSPVPRAVRKY